MRPMITFLTSTELQESLRNELSDNEMAELREFRDTVKEEFRQHLDAASVMEELYGESWSSRDLRVWMAENGNKPSISSPIIINEDTEEEAVFKAFHMLAKNLIRQNYPDSKLVEKGYDKLDAVSALLARESLSEVMESDRLDEIMDDIRDSEDLKTWRKMDDYAAQWDKDEQSLFDWLESHG